MNWGDIKWAQNSVFTNLETSNLNFLSLKLCLLIVLAVGLTFSLIYFYFLNIPVSV